MIIMRYVLKEFLKFVAGSCILCTFLFTLFDFIHKSGNYFATHQPSPKLIASFYFYQMPFQIVQTLPIASLLSSVTVMVLLNRTNEVTAMRAAGMTPRQIAMPLFLGGVLMMCAGYILNEVIVPRAAQHMHYIKKVKIEGESQQDSLNPTQWIRRNSKLFHYGSKGPNTILRDIELLELDTDFFPKSVLTSKVAVFRQDQKKWFIQSGHELHLNPAGVLSTIKPIENELIELPITPKNLEGESRLPDELSISELGYRVMDGHKSGMDVIALNIAWHTKLSFPLAILLVSMIGLPFGYRSERAPETVKGILLAIAVGIGYWFLLSAGRALASTGDIPTWLGPWLGSFYLAFIIGAQSWRINRT
ncbi:MAG: LptF/LptG family permease [Zetaproteobacteria bacterium]|nr:LptF/LptG family permease [Zetaproteobacteria bacterium]